MYLADIDPGESERAARALRSLIAWIESRRPEDMRITLYNAAIDSVNRAILATRSYQRQQHGGAGRDGDVEDQLSRLWSEASSEIRPYDAHLADLCMVKGHGWADPSVWDQSEYKKLPIHPP